MGLSPFSGTSQHLQESEQDGYMYGLMFPLQSGGN